jgi:hypothetical protein
MRHKAAQGNHFGAQRAEAFDENNEVKQVSGHDGSQKMQEAIKPNGITMTCVDNAE